MRLKWTSYGGFFINLFAGIGKLSYVFFLFLFLFVGGVWVNAGPLHYHMLSTIQYSYAQIIDVIKVRALQYLHHHFIQYYTMQQIRKYSSSSRV